MSGEEKEPLHPAVVALRDTITGLRDTGRPRARRTVDRWPQVLERMPLFPDQFLYVYDYKLGRMTFTRGFAEVLGYADTEVDVDLIYRTYHPEDAPTVARLTEVLIRTMTRLPAPVQPFDLCVTMDYRMRKANGEYIKVLRQSAIDAIDAETGLAVSTVSICKDISTIKTSNRIGWQVRGSGSELLDVSMLRPHMPALQYRPTPREIEVIRKLAEGKSSKLIAHELRLSEHTVAAHRRNLLQRTGLKNTAELVSHVKEAGWL